jgi:hypothetical protein
MARPGLEASALSDAQIARQIGILRAGLHRPTPGELAEIRARARRTEPIFAKAEREVLDILAHLMAGHI